MPDKKQKQDQSNEIETRIRRLISENLGVDETEITSNANIEHDLGADSLDRVELVMMIEEEFEIEVADAEAEDIKTVKDAVDYVTKQLHKKHNGPRVTVPVPEKK